MSKKEQASESGHRIQFVNGDGVRKGFRLGRYDKRTVAAVRRHVSILNQCQIANQPVPADTAIWLKGLSDKLHAKLASVGLVEARKKPPTVDELTTKYFGRADIKQSTKAARRYWTNLIAKFFGDKVVNQVTSADCDGWVQHLIRKNLSPHTIARILKFGRQVFNIAVRERLIDENPMRDVRQNFREPHLPPRDYMSAEYTRMLTENAPPGWRELVALARYAGLRAPSEPFVLKWQDVDLANRRMTVTSPKTERAGKPWRVVPIFDDLLKVLEVAWERAPEGAVYVVDLPAYRKDRASGALGNNPRTQLNRIIKAAAMSPVPKFFKLCRSSCLTDWARKFPPHMVAAWAGNTVPIIGKHYLTVTMEDVSAAARWSCTAGAQVVQQVAEQAGMQTVTTAKENPQALTLQELADPCGFEPELKVTSLGFEPRTPSLKVTCSTS